MRTILKTSLVVGELAIPVGLAVTHARGDVAFRTLHRECATPVKERSWCPLHERVVDSDELVKGWEVAPGQFVVVEPDELAAVTPEADREISLGVFVGADDLPRLWLDRSYYLAPSREAVMRRPYVLLADSLRRANAAGIGRLVSWGSERIVAVRASGERTLVLEQLRYPADIVPADGIEEQLADVALVPAEQELALELIARLTRRIDRADLGSRQRPRVQELLDAKLAGRKIATPAPAQAAKESAVPALDLAEALRRSLRGTRRRRTTPAARTK